MKETNKTNIITNILFSIYLIAIFWIIVFKFEVPFTNMGHLRSINLIPFGESLIVNGKINFSEIIMNMVIFIPFGIYIEIICYKASIIKKASTFLIASLICEMLQFIFAIGASDITDIINNTLGGIIGLVIYKIILKVFKNSVKAHKFINAMAATGTLLMILLLSLVTIANL